MSTNTPTFDAATAEPDGAPLDTVFDALADERRRQTVSRLVDSGGAMSVDRLLATVVTEGRETETLADGSGRHAIRFHHVHLPKLEDAGLVEYDYETETVELTEFGKTIEGQFDDLPH